MSQSISVLLVEDDDTQRSIIKDILSSEGMQVLDAESVESAILLLKTEQFDVVFSDWKLGSLSGIDLLNYVRKNQPELGFAIATAYGTIAHAVNAIEAGADDYLAKPFQRQELLLCVEKVYKASQLRRKNQLLSAALSEQRSLVDLVGTAPCMQQVYARIERISNTDVTVLINGESGTGKELAARALHELSTRKSEVFVAVNCGAIPESLAESELFGHAKGAFTGASESKAGKLVAADGGTLFLDEIGELPLSLQAKLLRFLQEGVVTPVGSSEQIQLNVRVIAATHRNLQEMVQAGEFREDLFYRLNIVPIVMPALRERKEDIGKLIEFFLQKFGQQYGLGLQEISKSALKQLIDYRWPGNVRELSNRIERFVLLGSEDELLSDLDYANSNKTAFQFEIPEQGMDWEQFEKDCLSQAMAKAAGNKTAAAKLLGLNYKAFLYRLDKYELVKNTE